MNYHRKGTRLNFIKIHLSYLKQSHPNIQQIIVDTGSIVSSNLGTLKKENRKGHLLFEGSLFSNLS